MLIKAYAQKVIFLAIFFASISCNTDPGNKIEINQEYIDKFPNPIDPYREYYLQLTGLFELNEGLYSLGSDSTVSLQINSKNMPNYLGDFIKIGDSIYFEINPDLYTEEYREKTVLTPGKTYTYGNIFWTIVNRGNIFLRVGDRESKLKEQFQGFERFGLNANYIFPGKYSEYAVPETKFLDSETGKREVTFIGEVSFKTDGKTYNLKVMQDGFLMVADKTSAKETYGGGRYMYLDISPNKKSVIIDFNRLYNPACAYSKFTTCLFPPESNILKFAVKAGEKYK